MPWRRSRGFDFDAGERHPRLFRLDHADEPVPKEKEEVGGTATGAHLRDRDALCRGEVHRLAVLHRPAAFLERLVDPAPRAQLGFKSFHRRHPRLGV